MRTGYICQRPGWTAKRQEEILLAAGIPASRIWIEGRGGETLKAAVTATRGGVLECAGGYRALGENRKQIMDALAIVNGATVMDAETKETHGGILFGKALAAIRYEKIAPTPEAMAAGGRAKGEKMKRARMPEAKARRIWLDKSISTNAEAISRMNEGHEGKWTPETAYNHFKGSGRPPGRAKLAAE